MSKIYIEENGRVKLVLEGAKITPKEKVRNKEMMKVIVKYTDENGKSSETEGFVKSTTSTVTIRKNIFQILEEMSPSAARSATIQIEFPTSDTMLE